MSVGCIWCCICCNKRTIVMVEVLFYCFIHRNTSPSQYARQAERTNSMKCEPSFLSEVVCTKGAEVMKEVSDLLSADAFDDIAKWGTVWQLIPPAHVQDAKVLIVSLALRAACGWQMRFVDTIGAFPLAFFVALEAHPTEECEKRKMLAAKLLGECQACLERQLTDMPWKIRVLFQRDWEHMRDTGTCTLGLYIVLLAFRAL